MVFMPVCYYKCLYLFNVSFKVVIPAQASRVEWLDEISDLKTVSAIHRTTHLDSERKQIFFLTKPDLPAGRQAQFQS